MKDATAALLTKFGIAKHMIVTADGLDAPSGNPIKSLCIQHSILQLILCLHEGHQCSKCYDFMSILLIPNFKSWGYSMRSIGYWYQYLLLCCVVSLGASMCARHPTFGHVCPCSCGDRGTPAFGYLNHIATYTQVCSSLAVEHGRISTLSLFALEGTTSMVRALSFVLVLLEYLLCQYWVWKWGCQLATTLASCTGCAKEILLPQSQS